MYAQILAAVALTGSANALIAKPRQAACTQFTGNVTGLIQHAQGQLTILEQTLRQNTTVTSVAAQNVDAALDAVFLSISIDKDEPKVCDLKAKSASEQAADTWANRDIEVGLLQQASSRLQIVQQSVNNCDYAAALNDFCALERFLVDGDGADTSGVTTTSIGSGSKTDGTSSTAPSKNTAPSANNAGETISVAPPSPEDSCGKFASDATAMIQKAQTDASKVLQDLAQNVTSGNGIPEVVAFMTSFNELFNGVLPGHNMSTICNVTVPTIEQAEAAAKAAKIQPTYELRVAQEQLFQQQILFPLEKVAQDVAKCDQPAAIADYCRIAQFYYQAPPKPSPTASAKPSSTASAH